MGDEFKLEDILIILRRRVLFFLAPAVILAPLGVLIVLLLPSQYTARGTILVESQQIPEELIQSTINSYAQERIQVIRQRVMTRERLLGVADKYDLFDDRRNYSSSDQVEHMRDMLDVQLISANSGDRSRRQDATIAFTVAYTDGDRQKAYLVANEFMTLFLTEDVRSRKDGASDTTEFFDQEANRLRLAVDNLETRIAAYKDENATALPEHLALHMQQLDRATKDFAEANDDKELMEEERRALETQLASYLSSAGGGEATQSLSELKAELATLRAEKTDSHPDVAALRDRVSALEREAAPSQEIQRLRTQLRGYEEALEEASIAEPADEEEIARLKTLIDDTRRDFSSQLLREASTGSSDFIVAQIQGRLEIANSRLASLTRESDELRATIADLQDRVARTPAVERGLAVLTRDQQNLELQYKQIQAKRQQAITAENLEDNQKAEKFSILEPAVQPEQPSSPDREKLMVLALVAALGIGAACAALAEMLMASVRGRDHLASLMGEAPIAVIPYIHAKGERRMAIPMVRPQKPTPSKKAA
ncbi:MAG: Wzz/FepE/Etk N-terminal domain-containing protein [Pseudomonadota bacterium]